MSEHDEDLFEAIYGMGMTVGDKQCVELFRYQRMRVFGVWCRMVERSASKCK